MAHRPRARLWLGRITVVAVAFGLWTISTRQSGYTYVELLVFAGPAVVLAVAANWAAAAFGRDEWRWTGAMRAAGLGAILLPPVIAAAIAFFSAWNQTAVLLTFILGAWLALGAGLLVASVRALWLDVRRSRRGAPAHLALLPQTRATRGRRSPARVGPRPRWAEYQPSRQGPASRERPSA